MGGDAAAQVVTPSLHVRPQRYRDGVRLVLPHFSFSMEQQFVVSLNNAIGLSHGTRRSG